jgi:HK97 family phage portal protein
MVLTEGLDVKELSMSSIDAELLDSRKYSVIDIARAFRVPPVMIGAQDTTSSWGTGVEAITLGFVKFTLQPYLTRIEQEINRKLIRKPDEFVEFNLKGLLRGDTKAENESLRQARGGSQGPGWLTLNEIRRIDNLPPVPGGDVIYEPKGALNEQKTTPAD